MLPTAAQRLMDAETPKINPLLGNGLAVEHMKHIENYLDAVFQSVASGFPQDYVILAGDVATH